MCSLYNTTQLQKNEILFSSTKWIELEITTSSKINQPQKDKYHAYFSDMKKLILTLILKDVFPWVNY